MRCSTIALLAGLTALGACSSSPRPLVPTTAQGPASYVCYASTTSSPEQVRAVADQQCGQFGLGVTGLIGQRWTPLRCGLLTPTVAAFQCGRPEPLPVPVDIVPVATAP